MSEDVLLQIIYKSDLKSIQNLCKTSRYVSEVCITHRNVICRNLLQRNFKRIPVNVNCCKLFKDIYTIDHNLENNRKNFIQAALLGKIDLVKLFVENGSSIDFALEEILYELDYGYTDSGRLDYFQIVKFLVENGAKIPYDAISHTLHNFEITKFLLNHGCKYNLEYLNSITENGYSDLLTLLFQMGVNIDIDEGLIGSASNGHLDMVKLFVEKNPSVLAIHQAISNVNRNGKNIEILKLLKNELKTRN